MSHPGRDDVDCLLEGLRPPAPPEGLRSRVLEAAAAVRPKPDRWAAMWHHRGLRVGWAAAVVLLLAGHLTLFSDDGAVTLRSGSAVVTESHTDAIADFLRPVEISADALPVVGRTVSASIRMDEEPKGELS